MQKLSREEVLEIVRVAKEKGERPDFRGADLRRMNLFGTDLSEANLEGANLIATILVGANLSKANLSNTNLKGASLSKANLSKADLSKADLSVAILDEANLSRAHLGKTDLSEANLSQAKLIEADLIEANLSNTNLDRANLSGVNLKKANLRGANLSRADLSRAFVGWTIFGNTDLSKIKGLDTVIHQGPSIIDVETLFRSKGKIPEVFLRGAGVPEVLITYLPSMLGQAIQFYSCFISYSVKDTPFATRLHADLQQKGVRCWFAPEDMKIGAKLRPTIDETIRLHDKLLLVLSEHSVRSQWVEQEVETALARERKQDETVLFPIRLDNTVIEIEGGWPELIKNTRHIGDFREWMGHESYQKAFQRLLKDLRVEKSDQ